MKAKKISKSTSDRINEEMTMAEYYGLFIKPALQMFTNDKEQRLGVALIRYLINGTRPKLKSQVDKLLWNGLMVACNVGFNTEFADMPAYEVQEAMNGTNL